MRLIATIATVCLMLPFPVTAAVAQASRVVQTGCDTLTTEPLTVRVEFAIDNYAPSMSLWLVQVWPECYGTACCILGCGAPSGWSCGLPPPRPGDCAWWEVDPDSCCLDVGERQDGFSIIYQPQECCFWIDGLDTAVGRSPWHEVICFALDEAVPALPSTWGRLKARYR